MENVNNVNNNKISCLDAARFIAAVFIVLIHCFREESGFMNVYGSEINARWGVAIFFMISGFFLKEDFGDLVKYLVNILLIYTVWTIFYAIVIPVNIWNPWDFFLAMRSGIIMPFWYFPSLLMCAAFVWVLSKIVKSREAVVVICGVLFVIGLMGDTFSNVPAISSVMDKYFFPVFERIMGSHDTRDGIFNGSFYIAIGMLLRKYSREKTLEITNKKRFYLLFAIAAVLHVGEIVININTHIGGRDLLITTPLMTLMIFLLAYNHQMDKDRAVLLREMSTYIFLVHYLFITNLQKVTSNQWIWFAGALTFSVIVSYLIVKCKMALSVRRKSV